MSASMNPSNSTRITGSTGEQLVSANPTIVLAIIPDNTTAGTVTLRDGNVNDGSGATLSISAIGLQQQGKQFGAYGVGTGKGLTCQLSSASDAVLVIWMPKF